MTSTFLGVDQMDGDGSGNQMSPSKKLQHAILQICNEYVTYDRTLQVLGVICLTIDDQQPEIVVKVNNTLKRFKEPETLPLITSLQKADAKVAQLLNLSTTLPPITHHEEFRSNDQMKTSTPLATKTSGNKTRIGLRSVKSSRKGHGRKQSNPLKVSHTPIDYVDENSSSDSLVIDKAKELATTCPPTIENASESNTEMEDALVEQDQRALSSEEAKKVNEPSRKRLLDDVELSEERSPKVAKVQAKVEEEVIQMLLEADPTVAIEADDDLRRLVIIEPLEGNLESGERSNEPALSSIGTTLATFIEPEMSHVSKLKETHIIHIKEEVESGGEEQGTTTELEKLLKVDKPKPRQKNVLEESQYIIESRPSATVAPVARQLLPAPSTLLPNQIFAILPNTASVQQQPQTSGLARLLQPTTFYTITDKTGQSTANNCFSLQLTQMAKNVLKLPDNTGHTSTTNQIPLLKSLSVATGHNASLPTSIITLNKQQNNESDYLLDSFADEPELLSKIGLKSSSMMNTSGVSGRAHRRRIYDDVLTPEEIVEYVGSTDAATSSAALQRAYKCSCCDETLHNLLEYFRHTLRIHNAFVCHQCGKDFTTKSSLLRHRPIHTGLRRFACGICQKSFYRKDKCKAHIKMHFRFDSSTASTSTDNNNVNTTLVQSSITTQLVSLPTFVMPSGDGTLT